MSHLKSLKSKVLLILTGIFVLCGTAEYAIHRFIIYPSFLALERDEAQKDLERTVQALKREIHHLDSLAHDWSMWNDTYRFVRAPFEDYVRSRPILSSLLKDSVNLIYICDAAGRWGLEQGCREFASDVYIDDHDSLAAHRGLGFEETERVVYFRKPLSME